MGPTWQEIMKQMGSDRGMPRSETGPAIEAAAYYMAELRRRWNGGTGEQGDRGKSFQVQQQDCILRVVLWLFRSSA